MHEAVGVGGRGGEVDRAAEGGKVGAHKVQQQHQRVLASAQAARAPMQKVAARKEDDVRRQVGRVSARQGVVCRRRDESQRPRGTGARAWRHERQRDGPEILHLVAMRGQLGACSVPRCLDKAGPGRHAGHAADDGCDALSEEEAERVVIERPPVLGQDRVMLAVVRARLISIEAAARAPRQCLVVVDSIRERVPVEERRQLGIASRVEGCASAPYGLRTDHRSAQ